MTIRYLILSALLLTSLTSSAYAEVVAPGTRVRITTYERDLCESVGTVVSSDEEDVVLEMDLDGSRLRIPWYDIQRFQISEGSVRGTAYGAVAGLALGSIVGLLASSSSHVYYDEYGEPDLRFEDGSASGLIGGALVGAALGAVIGSAVRVETWKAVPWISRLDRREFGMGVRLSWDTEPERAR